MKYFIVFYKHSIGYKFVLFKKGDILLFNSCTGYSNECLFFEIPNSNKFYTSI